eukprot:6130980-Pleurochrysis_carterae.AAC.1
MPPTPATRTTRILSSTTNQDGSVTDIQPRATPSTHALLLSGAASHHEFVVKTVPATCVSGSHSDLAFHSSCCASCTHAAIGEVLQRLLLSYSYAPQLPT